MSVVTNVVLLCWEEKESLAIKNLNKHLATEDQGSLVEVSKNCGGTKHMYSGVWLMGCNHLQVEDFAEEFLRQEWERPLQTKLLLLNEHEDLWRIYSPASKYYEVDAEGNLLKGADAAGKILNKLLYLE